MTTHPLYIQFQNAARAIGSSDQKVFDLARNIADNPEFAVLAYRSPEDARYVLKESIRPLNARESWEAAMVILQSESGRAMADSIRPEYLLNVLDDAMAKMDPEDKQFIKLFAPETSAGKTLIANYPAARIKLMMG